jgi:hypothetical protein
MKTKNIIGKICLSSSLTLALAAMAWLPSPLLAGEPPQFKGGASDLMNLGEIKTQEEAKALKPGDTMAMVCTKCKSVMVHNVTTEKGHIKVMTVGEKHLCPGCNSTIETVGFGKGKHDEVKHVCAKCGDDSVFCCATKPGSGATKGMEKEKK